MSWWLIIVAAKPSLKKHLPLRLGFSLYMLMVFFPSPYLHALPQPSFQIENPDSEEIVQYHQYGQFLNEGTEDFRYEIVDVEGLKRASGFGVYPNDLLEDAGFKEFIKSRGQRELNPWDFLESKNVAHDVYVWAQTQEVDPGTKLYFVAEALRRAGHVTQAMKAYYALLVHFPKTHIWSEDGAFYWYAAPEAITRIRKLCSVHTDMKIQLEGAFVDIDRVRDGKPETDHLRIWPGRFVKADIKLVDVSTLSIVERRGGAVEVVKFENGHWQLRREGKPFIIKGITYTCTTVGESAHALNIRPWMNLDDNQNGENDCLFESWVDKNRNHVKDADERVIGDARLMASMGVNAIRFYHGQDEFGNYPGGEYNKELMRTLAKDYGIYFIMGDFLGAYTIGSGANWSLGTDYTDEVQKKRMKEMVRNMVLDHKDEPYVLMWLLGNENQHEYTHTNAHQKPEAYAKFVNEVAAMIKELDPQHPVAISHLNASGLREMSVLAPEIDIYGANVYTGEYTMGSVIQRSKVYYDRPLLFTEWGADAYYEGKGVNEEAQARYTISNWKDIWHNIAGGRGEGHVIGGVLFEWMDEWWKTLKGDGWGDPSLHNKEGDYLQPFPDRWAHEEWFGVMGQGNGRNSPLMRRVRKVYYELQKLWKT